MINDEGLGKVPGAPREAGIAESVRRAEESEEKFRKAFQSAPGAMSISTLEEGWFLDVNDRFLEFFGYAAEQMLGRTAVELGIWEDLAHRERMVEALRSGRPVRDWEVQVRLRCGERRLVRLSAELITIGGEPCILAVTHRSSCPWRVPPSSRSAVPCPGCCGACAEPPERP